MQIIEKICSLQQGAVMLTFSFLFWWIFSLQLCIHPHSSLLSSGLPHGTNTIPNGCTSFLQEADSRSGELKNARNGVANLMG